MVMWPSDREVASQFAVVFEAIKQLITPPEPAPDRHRSKGYRRRLKSRRGIRAPGRLLVNSL
ncbi:MAG: hypothetical protein DMC62_02160 [Verrucomicrobia bacterium]|nr:MAG: hypothetical protein DMC62_02160 [Verrucomicrobiota bacterium]